MGTTADKLAYLNGTKTAIKNAIVSKGVAVPDGTTFRAYAEKIGSIVKVPSLSNPGSASDLRSGKQLAGADGSVVTGTLAEVTQATPSIAVSSGGLITATATQSGGIVASGSKSATKQLTTQGAKTVMPTTTNQTAVASGRYTTGDVVVAGDANLVPENIAEGVSVFGVTGTHSGQEIVTCTAINLTSSYKMKIYYTNGDGYFSKIVYMGTYNQRVMVNKYSFCLVESSATIDVEGSAEVVNVNAFNGKVLFVTGNFTLDVQA